MDYNKTLKNKWFNLILSEKKTIEGRLNKDEFSLMNIENLDIFQLNYIKQLLRQFPLTVRVLHAIDTGWMIDCSMLKLDSWVKYYLNLN